ncbi:fructose-6-phosphate aldolase [Pectinatus haikarae]|uniref:TalC/MipB family fructose-6-phosphate aldolase n=1 Tax=Pectinatus haikarae TaxID=349096 RepID=A0ABT9Y7Y9_9FIRM|nr:fructose-6-phosphate aldolase [Pectinatus haikarae]MDQ0203950.1 TalC/MipB family fructose-6-phosphate aldolase [Pectinatus haikarae]
MQLLIDDANIVEIKKLAAFMPIDGVTTNPSILAKNGKAPFSVLREIRDFLGEKAMLHVQAVAADAEGIVEDAHRIQRELGENTYIKIPVVDEGLKAIKMLKKEGANITATAIYTQMQAFLAGKAGADYAAPYVNRIDNLGADGIRTAKAIHDIFKKNHLHTEVLAASFKNSQQVLALCEYGVGAATVGPSVLRGLLKNDSVAAAVKAFTDDFENLCGSGATMANCK